MDEHPGYARVFAASILLFAALRVAPAAPIGSVLLARGAEHRAPSVYRAVRTGGEWLGAWIEDGRLLTSRVSPDGEALGAATLVSAVGPSASIALAADGENALVVWSDRERGELRAARVAPGGEVLDPGGLALHSIAEDAAGEIALAFSGGHYLLAWTESTPDRLEEIRGHRFSPTLRKLEALPLTLASTLRRDTSPALAGNGQAFFLAWTDRDPGNGSYRVAGTLVTLDGAAARLDGSTLVDRLYGNGTLEVAWDGSGWLVTLASERALLARVGPDGIEPRRSDASPNENAAPLGTPPTDAPTLSSDRVGPNAGGGPGEGETVTKYGSSAADQIAAWLGEGAELRATSCTISGDTLVCSANTKVLNEVRHSIHFPSIGAAVEDLPPTGGHVSVAVPEDDATAFADTNPASETTGRRDTLVVDARRGGLRFLSSAPEYPSGESGALEDRVPFVFQTRLDDPSRVYDDEPGAIGEWNCADDVAGATDEWRNCPSGNSSWGVPGGSRQYWHSGQCNTKVQPDSQFGTSAMCGGPHILEVRYPHKPGVQESKPIFAVGNGGVSIYQPDSRNHYSRSYLTMFRGDPGDNPDQSNTPMYVFDRGGAFFDGGTFMGNTDAFPYYSRHVYPPFNAWVQKDILPSDPAFVVEGGGNTLDEEQVGPLVRFLDRSCCPNWDHTFNPGVNHREAFGFYANSVLKLASFTSNPALDRGQYIEWEGLVLDGNKTRLRVAEPTGLREFTLPDAPDAVGTGGKIQIASGADTHGTVMWGNGADEFDTGDEVCAAAGLVCVHVKSFGGGDSDCLTDQGDPGAYFMALCK